MSSDLTEPLIKRWEKQGQLVDMDMRGDILIQLSRDDLRKEHAFILKKNNQYDIIENVVSKEGFAPILKQSKLKLSDKEIVDILKSIKSLLREHDVEQWFPKEEEEIQEDFSDVYPLLFDPKLMEKIDECLEFTLRYDKITRRVLLKGMNSAYTPNPQNIFMVGPPSIGKSFIAVNVAKLFPQEDVWYMGNASPKFLARERGKYDREKKKYFVDITNRILLFLEAPDPETLEHLLPLLSHDKEEIEYPFVEKTSKGALRTKRAVVRGWPATIWCTTEIPGISAFISRQTLVTPEMDEEKYKEVLRLQGKQAAYPVKFRKDKPEYEKFRKIFRALKKFQVEIAIPYGELISEVFPYTRTDMRHHPKFQSLIMQSAKLLQFQRPFYESKDGEEIIVSTLDDYLKAFEEWNAVSPSTRLECPPYVLELFEKVLWPNRNEYLTYDLIMEKYYEVFKQRIGKTTLKDNIIPLEKCGLICTIQDPRTGRPRNIVKVIIPKGENEENVKSLTDINKTVEFTSFTKKDLEKWWINTQSELTVKPTLFIKRFNSSGEVASGEVVKEPITLDDMFQKFYVKTNGVYRYLAPVKAEVKAPSEFKKEPESTVWFESVSEINCFVCNQRFTDEDEVWSFEEKPCHEQCGLDYITKKFKLEVPVEEPKPIKEETVEAKTLEPSIPEQLSTPPLKKPEIPSAEAIGKAFDELKKTKPVTAPTQVPVLPQTVKPKLSPLHKDIEELILSFKYVWATKGFTLEQIMGIIGVRFGMKGEKALPTVLSRLTNNHILEKIAENKWKFVS